MSKASNLIADISDAQASFNAAAYRAAGHTRIRIKATQGVNFTAHTYVERVEAAHAAGLAVDHYHYLDTNFGEAQAEYFLAAVMSHVKPGDRFMADAEATGVNGAIVSAFVSRCVGIVPGLVYGSPYFLRDNHIVSTHGWGLVLADYPEPYTKNSEPVFWPEGFPPAPREWQFTETGHLDGIGGDVDISIVVKALHTAEPDPNAPRDLTFNQERATRRFTKAMLSRKHPLTDKANTAVDAASAAIAKAKDIKS
jgi:GH25 family lysozyme M1 (1,4-beta-N-acetylmuramidase)